MKSTSVILMDGQNVRENEMIVCQKSGMTSRRRKRSEGSVLVVVRVQQ